MQRYYVHAEQTDDHVHRSYNNTFSDGTTARRFAHRATRQGWSVSISYSPSGDFAYDLRWTFNVEKKE